MGRLPVAAAQTAGTDRLVVKPGLIASVFNVGLCLAWAVLFALMATEPGNSIGATAFAVGLALLGLLGAVYIVGMRVEADGVEIAKLYIFGLYRRRIPWSELDVSHSQVGNANLRGSYTVEKFRGSSTSFGMTPVYVWRSHDVRALVERALAYSARHARSATESRLRCPNPDCVGGVMSKVRDSGSGQMWRCELCGTEEFVSNPKPGR